MNDQELDSIQFNSISIIKIDTEEMTDPTFDGSKRSDLHDVPFILSAEPPKEWQEYFTKAFRAGDMSQLIQTTSGRTIGRPEISFSGNKVFLKNINIINVQNIHRPPLIKAVDKANEEYSNYLESEKNRIAKVENFRKEAVKVAESIMF